MLKFLLSKGADANGCNNKGEPALHQIVEEGNVSLVELLLSKGADPNGLCTEGYAPLHHAYDYKTAKCLIAHGASVNMKDKQGRTPLFCAVWDDRSPVLLPVLCSHGADLNIQDNQGLTCLHAAVMQESYFSVKYLLNHGAGINIRDRSGHTPLYYAYEEYKKRDCYDSNTGRIYINLLTERGGRM